ncbi:hypothetical protein BOTBODRAFT_42915 [Botryobasidium botryosum FD-172 SS1]|uniref:Uncharacterized protein n=1 Tax=Botryobasidium botryosum (strain FD-172 SS1) TaxID=930990 RepID=A0A067MNS1_BOTB1|nr:hypothetical protein BOTBODRAFT_42915 [Botryobasidium botryosum FD-172 SS1]
MTTTQSHRASLLSGLRTGGVRSASNPSGPYSAGPTTTSFPRFVSSQFGGNNMLYEDDEVDALSDLAAQNLHFGNGGYAQPMTPTFDSRFQQQQHQQARALLMQQAQAQAQAQVQATQRAMNGMSSFGGNNGGLTPEQAQAMQMQMEILRLQALQQQQQFQAQMMAQLQLAQQNQQSQPQPPRRRNLEPTTAGPHTTSFDLRSVAASAQSRARTTSMQLQQPQFVDEVPMTASLGGKFGSRSHPTGLNPNANVFVGRQQPMQPEDNSGIFIPSHNSAPSFASVVGGGNSNANAQGGNPVVAAPAPTKPEPTSTPLKSDSAVNWRKPASKSPSPPPQRAARSASQSPPTVVISRPGSVYSPTSTSSGNSPTQGSPPRDTRPLSGKARPQALRFNPPAFSAIATDESEETEVLDHVLIDNGSLGLGGEEFEPTTPTPTSSSSSGSSLPSREEASKRLYEGLGIGRPMPAAPSVAVPRQPVQPVRQPRGPPSGVEDLGQRNFAARIRRQAIGGLGVLMGAREKRENLYVEAY